MIPCFGTAPRRGTARIRRAAYGVFVEEGRVSLVRAQSGWFLPGGGCREGEGPGETVVREALEECGRPAGTGRFLGEAIQFFEAGGIQYEMHASFYEARFTGPVTGPSEHELHWVDPVEAAERVRHACHAWAIDRACKGS